MITPTCLPSFMNDFDAPLTSSKMIFEGLMQYWCPHSKHGQPPSATAMSRDNTVPSMLAWSLPILLLFPFVLSRLLVAYGRKCIKNSARRSAILSDLGVSDTPKKKLVGFFHPYWYVTGTLFHPLVALPDST